MWARLEDELIDHRKLFAAGALLGREGPGLALALYVVGLLWSNRHLSDGHLPLDVVKRFPHVSKPVAVADALVSAGLWEKNGSGFVIHDYVEYNFSAATVKRRRKQERDRKRRERAES